MPDLIPTIRDMLRQGLGVEDIAVQLDIPVTPIRRLMKRWQDSGAIWAILGRACGPSTKPPK